ncbi:LamG domain-containing protein [Aquimarina sp. MAR_2010_214]|nr:LamG domain-containing protein [Aquimarina sp. MAR_2010_214]
MDKGNGERFFGAMDDILFFNKALNDIEIAALAADNF